MLIQLPNDELHEVAAILPGAGEVTAERIYKDMNGRSVIQLRKTKSLAESREVVREMVQQLNDGRAVIVVKEQA